MTMDERPIPSRMANAVRTMAKRYVGRPESAVPNSTRRELRTKYSACMTLTLWLVLIVAAVATALVVFASWRHGIEMTELGTVSQNWLSEQRAHDRHYSER